MCWLGLASSQYFFTPVSGDWSGRPQRLRLKQMQQLISLFLSLFSHSLSLSLFSLCSLFSLHNLSSKQLLGSWILNVSSGSPEACPKRRNQGGAISPFMIQSEKTHSITSCAFYGLRQLQRSPQFWGLETQPSPPWRGVSVPRSKHIIWYRVHIGVTILGKHYLQYERQQLLNLWAFLSDRFVAVLRSCY